MSLKVPLWERIWTASIKAIISSIAELLKPSVGAIILLCYTSQCLTCWSNCPSYAEILSTTSLKDANPTNSIAKQIVKGSVTPCNLPSTGTCFDCWSYTTHIHLLFYWNVLNICEESNTVWPYSFSSRISNSSFHLLLV